MARCRNCGPGTCSCDFDSSDNATQTGNGRSYAPINWRPTNVPLPRPFGHMRLDDDPFDGVDVTTVPASTEMAIRFGADYVPFEGGMVNPSITPPTPQTRLTCPVGGDGYYLAWGYASFTRTGYQLCIRKNGSEYLARQTGASNIVTFQGNHRSVNTLIDMVAGDYLELVVISTSTAGAIINFDFGTRYNSFPQFWAQWMRGV